MPKHRTKARRSGAPSPKPSRAAGPEAAARAFEQASKARDYARARAIIEDAVRRHPGWTAAKIVHAQLLYEHFGEVERPRAILEPLAETEKEDPNVLALLSTICAGAGQGADAIAFAERSIARFPEAADAYQIIQRIAPARGPELRKAIEAVMASRRITDRQRLVFHATLGRIADKEGDNARAFAEYRRANALQPGRYDPAAIKRYFEEMAQSFDAETLERLEGFGAADNRPVFIIGLPRSGSTLLERILGQHAKVDTAGERAELAVLSEELRGRYAAPPQGRPGSAAFFTEITRHEARAVGARYAALIRPALKNPNALRWLDKMPGNFILIGLIRTVLPQARIIHARRSPLDVALSCFTQSFQNGHPYAQSLPLLAHYLVMQRRLMAHWRGVLGEDLLEIDYEDVVEDLEREARRGLGHLGLDWDAACLSPQESDRPVVTASISQVRQPIYKGSIGRWRRYEAELAPLFETWRAMGDDVYRDILAAVRDA